MKKHAIPAFAGMTSIAAALLAASAIADPGTAARNATLRDEPKFSGQVVAEVAANTAIEITERNGGWYKIKAPGNKNGWTRMSSIRLAESGQSTVLGQWAGLFESGRSANTRAASTTGVRGLDEQDLAKAQPNFGALDSLAQYSSSPGDASQFAAQLNLQASKIPLEKQP